jgi:hypothetical protein
MNERIRELMLLAGTDTSGKWMGVEHAERFAELIIQECIDYCGENLSKTVGGALKKHFGIK